MWIWSCRIRAFRGMVRMDSRFSQPDNDCHAYFKLENVKCQYFTPNICTTNYLFLKVIHTIPGTYVFYICSAPCHKQDWLIFCRYVTYRTKNLVRNILSILLYAGRISSQILSPWLENIWYGIGLSYRPAGLHRLTNGWYDYIPRSGTKNLASTLVRVRCQSKEIIPKVSVF